MAKKGEIPPHKARNVGNDIFGEARLELAKLVKPLLNDSGTTWFLDGGTLMGAYRDGKFIPHDDDFDTAAYFPVYQESDLVELMHNIKRELPNPYDIRLVTSYAQKLEIFDTTSDRYLLPSAKYKGADFHTVTVDIQVMTDQEGSAVYLHDMLKHIRVPINSLRPTGEIECEGELFNSPKDTKNFLTALYGYLGADSKYDPTTKKYVKIE